MAPNVSSMLEIQLSDYHNHSSPVKDLLKVYVYEGLPYNLSSGIEKRLKTQYADRPGNNLCAGLAIVNLFKTFPGRTWDPTEADIFVVPYLHSAHCDFADGYRLGCKHMSWDKVLPVFDSLSYFNESTKNRHLFLAMNGHYHSRPEFFKLPLLLLLGPRMPDGPPGHILVPPFNDKPNFQPSAALSRDTEWWTRPRTHSFAFIAGLFNPRMRRGPRRIRKHFYNEVLKSYNGSVGGLPYISKDIGGKGFNWSGLSGAYEESVFCPVLAGDDAWQRRFFDVMHSGCLPTVVAWNATRKTHRVNKTWWDPVAQASGKSE
jgi:hypothetical protein